MRNRLKACSLLLWLLLLSLLAGCLPTPAPTPTSSLPTPTVTLPPPTATPTVAVPRPLMTTLRIWVPEELSPYGEGTAAELLTQYLGEFGQANGDLQVEVIVKKAQGRGGLLDFLRTASAAAPSVLPDLVVLNTADLRVAAQAGLLTPLDEILPEDLAADRFPFAAELGKVGEETVGIPLAVDLQHLAYRRGLLPSAPITWTNVLSAGISFAFPAASQADGVNDATLVQYLGAGGRLTDADGNPQLEADPLVAVLSFYTQAVTLGVISPTLVLSMDDAEDSWALFQAGQAGMAVVDAHRFWSERDPIAAPALIPTRTGRAVALARGWMLAMVTNDPERQLQAMRLASWLLEPQRHGAWTQNAGYLPATRGGLAAWMISQEERTVLETLLESAQPVPPATVRAAVGPPLQTALEAVLRGRRTPIDAAAEAIRAVQP